MCAQSQNFWKYGQKFIQICSPFSQRKMCDWFVVIKDVKGEHIHKNLNFVNVCVFTWTSWQDLKRKQLTGCFIDGYDLTIQYKGFKVLFMSFHTLLYAFYQINISLCDVLKISWKNADLSMIIMHLTSQTIVLILTSKLFAIKPGQDILKASCGFGQHGFTRYT